MLDVLFVDDEERVLDALRDALRAQRRGWRMRFAPGAPEALRLLAQHPADVIVTDLRMPGMNGADLLAAIAEQHPQTIGIVLGCWPRCHARTATAPRRSRWTRRRPSASGRQGLSRRSPHP
jgi:YesN/AraC family two-component response regulator